MARNTIKPDESLMTIEVTDDLPSVGLTMMTERTGVEHRIHSDHVETEDVDYTNSSSVSEFVVVGVAGISEDEFAVYESEFCEFVSATLAGETEEREIEQTGRYTMEVTDSEDVTLTIQAIPEDE